MGALPKRKLSKARQGERRSHLRLVTPALIDCPQCHKLMLSHRVCPFCGSYKGITVIELTPKKKHKR